MGTDVIEPLHDVIRAQGEAPAGQLRTAGHRGFVDEDGTLHEVPLWFVVTTHRAWLLAVHGDRWKAVASPTRDEVGLERGWVVDTLRVGPWTVPLRPSTRAAAQKLLARFRSGAPAGEPLLPEAAPPPHHRAPLARGALGVPEALARTVDAPAGSRWLLAVRTRAEQPFDTVDGKVLRGPVWLALGDQHQVLWAEGPDEATWSTPVGIVHDDSTRRQALVLADRRRLPLDEPAPPWLDLVEAPVGQRWALVADRALRAGAVRDSVRLLAEALEAGHREAWPVVARLLFAAGDPLRSMAAAVRVLRDHPDWPIQATCRAWHPAVDAQHMRRDDADVHFVRGLLRDALAGLEAVEPPDDLPWPPRRPLDVWGAALAHLQRPEAALPLLADHEPGLARLDAEAALKTRAGAPDAADAWFAAAVAHHGAGSPRATDHLDKALQLRPDPARHHLRAAWAWAAGDTERALGHWTAAMLLDPDATVVPPPLPADAEAAFARQAEAEDEPDHAALAWERRTHLLPDEPAGWAAAIRLQAGPLGAPTEAARLALAWAEHADAIGLEAPPRWARWVEVARHRRDAGEATGALDALHTALEGDFLRVEAYDAVLDVATGLESAPVRWWRHLRGVLVGQVEGGPRAPVPTLDAAALDALHPGGAGWLDAIRQRIDAREPPERAELLRGLGRIDPDRFPAVIETVDALSTALGLDPPDIYLFRGDGAWGCSAWSLDPPLVLLGMEHLRPGPRALVPDALRFLVAVELVHLAAGHPVLAFDADLVGTSRSIYASFGRYASTAENIVDVMTLLPGIDQIAKIQTVVSLSRKVFTTRSTLDKVGGLAAPVLSRLGLDGGGGGGGVGREGLEGAALQFRLQADRAALALTGDLRAALDAILRSSTDGPAAADRLAEEGLLAALETSPAEGLRLTSLVDWAAALRA